MADPAGVESLARTLRLAPEQVAAFLDALKSGKSPYYVQRYEKATVGVIDDEQVAALLRAWREETRLVERKAQHLKSLPTEGEEGAELRRQIEEAPDYASLESVVAPFKARRYNPFSRHQGDRLKPIADAVANGSIDEGELASQLSAAKGDLGVEADDDARRLLVEVLALRIGSDRRVRNTVLNVMRRTGGLHSRLLEEAEEILHPERPGSRSDGDAPQADDVVASTQEETQADSEATAPVAEGAAEVGANEESSSAPASEQASSETTDYRGMPVAPADDETASAPIVLPLDANAGAPSADAIRSETSDPPSQQSLPESTAQTGAAASVSADDAFVPAEAIADPNVSHTQGSESGPVGAGEREPQTPSAGKPNAEEARAALLKGVARSTPAPTGGKKKQAEAESQASLAERRKQGRRIRRQRAIESYRPFFNFRERLDRLSDFRILALNRGHRANVLQVDLEFDRERAVGEAASAYAVAGRPHEGLLSEALRVAVERYAAPEAEKELRREMGERAERYALAFQTASLREYLLEKPRKNVRVLALEPGFRAGWKAAALDEQGRVLETTLVHLIGREDQVRQSKTKLREMLEKHRVDTIVLGKGHAWRECERAVQSLLRHEWKDLNLSTVFVHPAGIAEYGGGAIARDELSQVDRDSRSVVTLGRRAQRPLEEWVKVGADQVAVGLHFDDLAASPLRGELNEEPVRCVHHVGLELNSASPQALRLVAGLDQILARRIAERRETSGPFRSREELRQIAGMTEEAWKQAAGFLRIEDADQPFDRTRIHPKDYELARQLLAEAEIPLEQWAPPVQTTQREKRSFAKELLADGDPALAPVSEEASGPADAPADVTIVVTASDVTVVESPVESAATVEAPESAAAPPVAEEIPAAGPDRSEMARKLAKLDLPALAERLGADYSTLDDIVEELIEPGRDPRVRESFAFRGASSDVAKAPPGTMFTATVQRVADFGVFADVGFEQRGLVHVSKLSAGYVENPHEVLTPGAVFPVWMLKKDEGGGRFSLSAIPPSLFIPPPVRADAPPRREEGPRPARGPGRQGGPPRSGAPQRGAQGGGQGAPSGSRPPRGGRPPAQGSGPPQRKAAGRVHERPAYRPAPPPLSQDMVEGKQPLRSFSDLKQLFEQKKDDKKKKP